MAIYTYFGNGNGFGASYGQGAAAFPHPLPAIVTTVAVGRQGESAMDRPRPWTDHDHGQTTTMDRLKQTFGTKWVGNGFGELSICVIESEI